MVLYCAMLRAILILLLPLGAAACTAPRKPPQETGTASPLARAALAEWEDSGRHRSGRLARGAATRYRREAGALCPPHGILDGCPRRGRRRAPAMGPALRHRRRIGRAVRRERQDGGGKGLATWAVVAAPGPEDMSIYAFPAWSAAFVSAIARRAGIPESDLPATDRHARYIDALLARATAVPDGALFFPYAPGATSAPRPGDLLCADRSAAPLSHWSTARFAEPPKPADTGRYIVVRTSPGVVEAVGGNVQDLVVLRRLPADAAGRVLPAPPGQPPFVLVLAARDSG